MHWSHFFGPPGITAQPLAAVLRNNQSINQFV